MGKYKYVANEMVLRNWEQKIGLLMKAIYTIHANEKENRWRVYSYQTEKFMTISKQGGELKVTSFFSHKCRNRGLIWRRVAGFGPAGTESKIKRKKM